MDTRNRQVTDVKVGQWIYVTGLPRSGTTFVGRALSLSPEVDYFHEPFNPGCGIPGFTRRNVYLRPEARTAEADHYRDAVEHLMRYDVRFRLALRKEDPPLVTLGKRIVGSRGLLHFRLARLNVWRQAAVVKDPTGYFLTSFLAQNFGFQPVIVVKHPVALAGSWKRLGWDPNLQIPLRQHDLLDDLEPQDVALLQSTWSTPHERLAVLWRVVYNRLLKQAAGQSDWRVVTLEALSASPLEAFQELYTRLDLSWSEFVAWRLRRLTSPRNAAETRKVQHLRRNSAALFDLRRAALSVQERRAVYDIVEDVAHGLYSRSSFDID